MKLILYFALLLSSVTSAQVHVAKGKGDIDQTDVLQNVFNNPDIFTVTIAGKNAIDKTLQIPKNKVLKFEAGGLLSGKGIVMGGIVEAGYHQQIFDTTLTIYPQAVEQYFSVKWFGANGNGADDYAAIQKSINTCIQSNIRIVYLPAGKYNISNPLIIRGANSEQNKGDRRWFCTLEMLGESSFWDSNMGSEIITTFNNTFAIGIQTGKGCKIRKLKISGQFTPPFANDLLSFYQSSFETFTDKKCRDSRHSPYAAIVIDPFTNMATDEMPTDGGYPGLESYYGKGNNFTASSGSTATELEELSITGFVVGICSSPNGRTQNAEATIISKVQFENCKLAISGGQDQEKGNIVSNIHCWGGTHTIFATGLYGKERQAGNWHIDHANIAGGVVRFIYNEQHGYFATSISHVYAESLGSWGTINSEIACEISNCHIDFASPADVGEQVLLTSWGKNVLYRSCNFRYYGQNIPLHMEGDCTFENCYFSGKLINTNKGVFLMKSSTLKQPVYVMLVSALVALLLVCGVLGYFLLRRRSRV